MTQGNHQKLAAKMAAQDLEPYRRLVELQKQMIELAQQQAQAKRRCDALREQMTRAVGGRRPVRRDPPQRLAARLLKFVPGTLPEKTGFDSLNRKQPSSC